MAVEPARWVCLEVFGHRQHFGLLTEIEQFGAKFARIDVTCVNGHALHSPTYAGAAIFSITHLPGGEEEARRRTGAYGCEACTPGLALPGRVDDEDEDDDDDPHGLLEMAVAFAPTVCIGTYVVEMLLEQNNDESFSFRGPRAVVLGIENVKYDNPDDALDSLREMEQAEARNEELGERLAMASADELRTPLDLIDEVDRIFPGEPGRARELLAALREQVKAIAMRLPAVDNVEVTP